MAVAFLLDENMEPQVSERLDAYGYDVEHVGDIPALGLGAPDPEIAAYSRQEQRVILTYDDDFVSERDDSEFYCAVYFGDDTRSAKEVADIAHSMADAYPESAFDGVEYGSLDWL